MQRSVSTKLAGLLLACLVLSGLSACCGKSAAKPDIPLCPKVTEKMLIEMRTVTKSPTMNSPTIGYVVNELIPYCAGIKAMGE